MRCLSRKCAEYIIKAQMCSDAGKGVWEDYGHPEWRKRADKYGYEHKPYYICKAFDEIAKLRGTSGFFYYVRREEGAWGDICDIAYFNFKIEGKRYQISFHVPELVPDRYLKGEWHATRWDEKSSRDACWALSKAMHGGR